MNKKNYENKCFSPNWLEVEGVNEVEPSLQNLDDIVDNTTAKEVTEACVEQATEVNTRRSDGRLREPHKTNKEVRLESKRRKDLNTLLKELDEIKQNIERAAEKQHRLANLMSFYTGEFAK